MSITSEIDTNFFSILNDDCIYQILELLTLDDLCRFSRTCHRLQTLCENQFLRTYPIEASEEVRIGIGFDGKLRTRRFEYVKCFNNFVKNLKICLWDFGQEQFKGKRLELNPVTNFVETKCDSNLCKISIVGDIDLVALCNEIREFLHNVEIVQFMGRKKRGNDEAEFLKCCPNVTKLTLCSSVYVENATENVDAILEHKYDQLKHFFYMYCDALSLNAEKLKIFFQANDKIESLLIGFDLYVDEDLVTDRDECTVKCIQSFDYASNLRHLFLSVGAPLTNCFAGICIHLNKLCSRDHFKSLEIEILLEPGANILKSHAADMADWKQLSKIHVKFIPFTDVLPALRSLPHLKTIVLHNPCNKYTSFSWADMGEGVNVIQNIVLPQVEEIQIEYMTSYDDDVSYYIEQFAGQWTNLKRLLLPNCNQKFEVAELNNARENLGNSCELTILTDHEKYETNLDYKLVKLKRVRFESFCDSSPFQRYCIVP